MSAPLTIPRGRKAFAAFARAHQVDPTTPIGAYVLSAVGQALAFGGPTGAYGIPSAGFGPGTPLYDRTSQFSEQLLGRRAPPQLPKSLRDRRDYISPMLPPITRPLPPALPPGYYGARMANFNFGSFLESATTAGLGVYQTVAIEKAKAKAAKYAAQAAIARAQQQGYGYPPPPPTPYPYPPPAQVPAQIPYGDDMVLTNAAYTPMLTQANVLSGAVGAAGRAIASRLPALVMRLKTIWPTMAEAGVIALGTGLLANGISDGAAGPYAKASDNRVTGVMRGDIKAIKRVRRQGRRLQKVLRMAGFGHHRRPKTRTRTRYVRVGGARR